MQFKGVLLFFTLFFLLCKVGGFVKVLKPVLSLFGGLP